MTSEARVEIRVEIDPSSDPISGLLHDDGESHDCQGWVQFMAAVDAASSRGVTGLSNEEINNEEAST